MPDTQVVNLREDGYDVYIGRGSIFGNPYRIGIDGTRLQVIRSYKEYFLQRIKTDPIFKAKILELKGKRLGCFCAPRLCHGDVIKKYLNGELTE